MPGFNPDKINIHDLTVEEPEKDWEISFDPKEDLSKEDWDKMQKSIEENKRSQNWLGFSSVAANMKILDPKMDVIIDKTVLEEINKRLSECRGKSSGPDNWYEFISLAKNMKILFPDLDLNISKEEWEDIRQTVSSFNSVIFWGQQADMRIIDVKHNPRITLDDPHRISGGLASDKTLEEYKKDNDWASFSALAAEFRIIDPDFKVDIDQASWENIKDELKKSENRSGPGATFSWQAVCMKILAAEKVEVTEKGLEVIMPEKKPDLKPESPQMPEQRNF